MWAVKFKAPDKFCFSTAFIFFIKRAQKTRLFYKPTSQKIFNPLIDNKTNVDIPKRLILNTFTFVVPPQYHNRFTPKKQIFHYFISFMPMRIKGQTDLKQ